MTLTKTDLNAIGSLIDQKLESIKKDLANVGSLIDQKLEPIKQDLKKLKKDTNYIIRTLDKEIMHQAKHVDRIENHLHLPPIAD